MRIEFNAPITKSNHGVNAIFKILAKKGSVLVDYKKGHVIIEDFHHDKLDELLYIIHEHFEITSLSLNKQPQFKLRNDEKEVQLKKSKLKEEIEKKPNSISSQVKAYILKEKVFTLSDLRVAFPKANFGTLRSYVNGMKNENILTELERGKYAVR